jgi:cytochrome c
MLRISLVTCLVAVAIVVVFIQLGGETESVAASEEPSTALALVSMPVELSESAQVGATIFKAKCAACHGVNGEGQKGVAPPLIHRIYEPSHHGDESFQRAVALGVRQHHWPFGDMPKVDGLTRADVAMIVSFIREVQRENGIN